MGGGKERKMNGGSATTDQVKDGGGGGLKQKLLKTESTIKNILSKKLSAQCSAEYLGFASIK
jgi:hypothetical protein